MPTLLFLSVNKGGDEIDPQAQNEEQGACDGDDRCHGAECGSHGRKTEEKCRKGYDVEKGAQKQINVFSCTAAVRVFIGSCHNYLRLLCKNEEYGDRCLHDSGKPYGDTKMEFGYEIGFVAKRIDADERADRTAERGERKQNDLGGSAVGFAGRVLFVDGIRAEGNDAHDAKNDEINGKCHVKNPF